MEISKALQEEILSVQNKLKNAIRDHQICVVKLKDDPNNTDILDRIREIQLHIVSLGRWQKQVVQRLRNEVESFKAENALNGAKVSVASLLGLNNNNHITNNNEAARRVVDVVVVDHGKGLNGHSESRGSSKEDYEEIVRNGDVSSPLRDNNGVKERRSSSVEPASGDDEVVEVPLEAESPESEANEKPNAPLLSVREQQYFLGCLGLITSARLLELQNKRAERKRRSTANSHFVYSNWEVPMKRKRHAYLQSLGNAPQTRQTTARLNGPSPPPPSKNNSGPRTGAASKSTCPGVTTKSLIQGTKTPNILRNGDGKQQQPKELYNKAIKQETDKSSVRVIEPIHQEKLSQATSTGRAVHIPGLPSGLTIERIENDSTVCIACRNPGTLTICEYCSAKFHVSCHTTSPASSCYCPKCAARFRSKGLSSTDLEILRLEMKSIKKDKETVAAAYASRAFGNAGEDSEVHKASAGLCEADAAQTRQLLTAAALGINQLPSSTFLIPIAASPEDDVSVTTVNEQLVVPSSSALGSSTGTAAATAASRLGHDVAEQQQQSSILLNQLSQPNVVTSISAAAAAATIDIDVEPRLLLRQGQEIVPHGQSFLVVEKVSNQSLGQRRWNADRSPIKPKQGLSVLDYEWSNRSSTGAESQQSGLTIAKSSNYVTVEVFCNDDDRVDHTSENSADCVYISESSCGVPDLIELESLAVDETKNREPEVLNVSSGSSEAQRIDSPQSRANSMCIRDQQHEGDNDDGGSDGSSDGSNDDFLDSMFPGRYGYKIDVVDVDSSSSSSCELPPDSPDGQHVESEADEHVKLEETHLPASPRAELIVKASEDDKVVDTEVMKLDEDTKLGDEVVKLEVEDVKLEDEDVKLEDEDVKLENVDVKLEVEEAKIEAEEMEMVEESDSEQLMTVPDNKSDDAAKQDYRDEDNNRDKGQECP